MREVRGAGPGPAQVRTSQRDYPDLGRPGPPSESTTVQRLIDDVMRWCDHDRMRTTLEIDDRVLSLARERAHRDGVSLGRAVSDLALQGISHGSRTSRHGIPLFFPPAGQQAHVVTPELIEQYRDDDH